MRVSCHSRGASRMNSVGESREVFFESRVSIAGNRGTCCNAFVIHRVGGMSPLFPGILPIEEHYGTVFVS